MDPQHPFMKKTWKKVEIFKSFFISILGIHRSSNAEFAPFWMENKMWASTGKSRKLRLLKCPKVRFLNFFYENGFWKPYEGL
jgi:hypothetical protein